MPGGTLILQCSTADQYGSAHVAPGGLGLVVLIAVVVVVIILSKRDK